MYGGRGRSVSLSKVMSQLTLKPYTLRNEQRAVCMYACVYVCACACACVCVRASAGLCLHSDLVV